MLMEGGRWLRPARGQRPLETVQWTLHTKPSAIQHMRVHHRRADVRMPKQLLHGPDILARLEKVRRERMTVMPRAA
jgi:hypothetical protein